MKTAGRMHMTKFPRAADLQKRHRRQFAGGTRGFTLLELLISITLLVLIVMITMGAMRIGSRSLSAGERRMEDQERFRTVLSVIDAQIQSQVPLVYEDAGNSRYYFRGDNKTLRFATNYSIWGGRAGYVIVSYGVETTDTGKDVLLASEQVPGVEGQRNTRLIEAEGISFEYFHKDPSEEQGKWIEALLDGTVVPERIRLHIASGAKPFTLEFPVRVFEEMTATQAPAVGP